MLRTAYSKKSTEVQLPGIRKVFFKYKLLPDLLFFLAVVGLPSSFFNFVDKTVFVDLRLLFLLVGILYIFFNIKYLKKISHLKGGKLLLLLILFICFKIFHSIGFQNIPWMEVLAIFRTSFFFPIVTLGFLLYAAKMNNDRLYRFFYWLLTVTFLQGILYIIANLTGLNFYANTSKEFQQYQGTTILQNLQALPDYNVFLYTIALLTVFTVPKFKKHWLWLVPLLVTIISIVRSQMIVYGLILFCLYGFGVLSKVKLGVSKIFKAVFALTFFFTIAIFLFPAHVGRVINKFGFDQAQKVNTSSYVEEGTFKVRLDLIEEAFNRTERKDNLMLGNGYVREATKGEYDFVVGGDTLIAPVLWAEGFLGLFIRNLPVIFFLFFGFKNLRHWDGQIALIALLLVALILPEIFNAVQTKIFTYYHHYLLICYLLMMIIYNQEKIRRQETTDYSEQIVN